MQETVAKVLVLGAGSVDIGEGSPSVGELGYAEDGYYRGCLWFDSRAAAYIYSHLNRVES